MLVLKKVFFFFILTLLCDANADSINIEFIKPMSHFKDDHTLKIVFDLHSHTVKNEQKIEIVHHNNKVILSDDRGKLAFISKELINRAVTNNWKIQAKKEKCYPTIFLKIKKKSITKIYQACDPFKEEKDKKILIYYKYLEEAFKLKSKIKISNKGFILKDKSK